MRQKSPRKWLSKFIIAALIIMILSGYYFYSRYDYFVHTPVNNTNTEKMTITIKKGDSLNILSGQLISKNLIWDENSFKIYSKLNNIDRKILPGRYNLSQSLTIPEIANIITDPTQRQIVITIPEGSTIVEIDQKLTDLDLIKSGEFSNSVKKFTDFDKYLFLSHLQNRQLIFPLEGYLFPDTYFLNPEQFASENLISMMLNNFKNRLAKTAYLNAEHNLEQIIIVASMIEKEANKDVDRPLIADIIWKRLDANWQLGIDATLLYLKENREINYADLKKDTPYNTRLNIGLPPGPIANPGLASIEAAITPEKNSYFYYLTGKDGKMYYSVTLGEHNSKKARYLE